MASETIEDYQVLNLLGKGGFACVYRARSNKTGQEVAIKMLYNYFEDSNYVYLVLEMCHNGEFQRYLRTESRVLTEAEARKVMLQVVEGCMLYTMLVGQPPFDTDAVRSTLNRVIQAEFELPADLSPEARDLIQCLLRKNPKHRLHLRDVLSHPFMTKKSLYTTENCTSSEPKAPVAGASMEFGTPEQVRKVCLTEQEVNILESGEVCLEFVKNKGKEQRVVEVFSISSDGKQVTVFHPGDGGRGVAIGDVPPAPPSSCKTFTFKSLPDKYLKKYQYAARFVSLVRSKTPKVTLYTERAKCMLMENSPAADFEAVFYDGAKVSVTSKGVRIAEKTGTSLMLDSAQSSLRLCRDTQEIVDYTEKCRQQCSQLESVIATVQGNGLLKEQLFPVIVGRYQKSQMLPDVVKIKLEKLPIVLESLRTRTSPVFQWTHKISVP
nr:hypothetical protein BaRGS_019564 [Batillaria attramentaria]